MPAVFNWRGNTHENFQEKAGIPSFFVKIYAFSFLFMLFWAFLTRFPDFLLKFILMPGKETLNQIKNDTVKTPVCM